MAYFVVTVIGFAGGVLCYFIATEKKRRFLGEQERRQASLGQHLKRVKEENEAWREKLDQFAAETQRVRSEYDARVISYKELQDENAIVKRDLRNLDLTQRKLLLDQQIAVRDQGAIDDRAQELARRFLKDSTKWIGSSLNPNNFANCKQRLDDVVDRCREIGFDISPTEDNRLQLELRERYEQVVKAALVREEQSRIKARMREEHLRNKEADAEMLRIEREKAAIGAALAHALADASNRHSSEVEQLRAQLAEAEAAQRAVSQAQLTKAGAVLNLKRN